MNRGFLKAFASVNVLCLSIWFSSSAQSESDPAAVPNRVDYSARLLFRSYSPGLSLNPQVGFAQSVWGDTSTPWHGFIRPYITGSFSPAIVEGRGGIEIFPISILGVDLRRSFSQRFATTRNQDCDAIQCLGELVYTELSLQSFLGFGDYFGSVRWTRTFFDAVDDRTRPVYELGASVLLSPSGDNSDTIFAVIGKNLGSGFATGVLLQTSDYHSSGNRQDAQYVFFKSDCARFGFENFEATIGAGRFYSSRNIAEASVIAMVTYTGNHAIGFGR